MKHTFLLTLLIAVINVSWAQDDQDKKSKRMSYISSAGEVNFSGARIVTESGQEGENVMRFAPWFNLQVYNNWDGRSTGLFLGLTVRNVGFIYKDGNEKFKLRTYNVGVPVGFKLGDMNGMFLFAGYEFELPLAYKEKYFRDEVKISKKTIWFSDRVQSFYHSTFVGLNFNNGFNLKFKYYLTEFFNPDFDNSGITDPNDIRYPGDPDNADPELQDSREYITANVFYLGLSWYMFSKPYNYYRSENASEIY